MGEIDATLSLLKMQYNAEAVKGMMTVPDDREAAVPGRFCKMQVASCSTYLTLGEDRLPSYRRLPGRSLRRCRWPSSYHRRKHQQLKTRRQSSSEGTMAAFKTAGDLAKAFKSAGR